MEAIFKQAKEAQEKADSEFEEAQRAEEEASLLASQQLLASSNSDVIEPVAESKPKRAPRKATLATETKDSKAKKKKLAAGSTVRVLSGTFAEFVGNLKKLNRKTAKVTNYF